MDFTIITRPMSTRLPWFLSALFPPRKPQPSASASVSVSTQTVPNSRPPSVTEVTPSPEELLETRREGARMEAEETLRNLIGQEHIKRRLNEIQTWINICQKQGKNPKDEWYNIVLQGNEGIGKTTVARVYAKILFAMGIVDMPTIQEISGAALAAQGLEGLQQLITSMIDAATPSAQTVGVLLIEDPHPLTTMSCCDSSREVFDGLFKAMERTAGRVIVVLTGNPSEMEELVRLHPRFERIMCCTLQFTDFDSNDYLALLARCMQERFGSDLEVDGGLDGPYMQMAARRLVRAAAGNGSRNVHAVKCLLDNMTRRQIQCLLAQEQESSEDANHFSLSKEDLVGPRPADVMAKSEAWANMQKLVGQDAAKASMAEVIDTVEENYWRESRNQRPFSVRVNRIFVGPPGTGKSTVATLYGQVLAELGILTSGEVVKVRISHRSDVPLGIENLLESTVGKVILADVSDMSEASETMLDSLLNQLSLVSRHDRCIILVGPSSRIESMLCQHRNDMLKVFRQHHIVHFHPFSRAQIKQILEMKLRDQEVQATPGAIDDAMKTLEHGRMRQDFDNGRAIAHLLSSAHAAYERSQPEEGDERSQVDRILVSENFKADDVCDRQMLNFRGELKHTLVADDIVVLLERYHHDLQASWLLKVDPSRRVPLAIIFKGASGIGRRTVAHLFGRLYYAMGALASATVVECSATDLIPQDTRTASTQVRSLLEKSRGGVLFVEDAHRLSEFESATQTINDLIYLLPKHSRDTVVILAGSGSEMDQMLSTQPRLANLFHEEIVFKSPTPRELLRLLDQRLDEEKIPGPRPFFTDTRTETYREFTRAMQTLSMFPCWGNARDIDVLAMWMVSAVMRGVPLDGDSVYPPRLSEEQAMVCVVKMYNLKRDRLRYNQDPKMKSLPRNLSQPRPSSASKNGVRFPV